MARDKKLEEAAEALSKSPKTLRRWCSREGAPHDRGPRRCYLVDPAELRAWDKRRRAERAEARRRKRAAAVPPAEASAAEQTPAEPAEATQDEPASPEQTPAAPPTTNHAGPPAVGADPPPPPPAPRPRPRARPPRRAPPKDAEPEPEVPEAAKLRLAAELSRLASQAAAVRLTRVPGPDDRPEDLALLADGGATIDRSIAASEFAAVAEAGGLLAYAREGLGVGHFDVAWVSPSLVELHRERLEVPSVERLAYLHRTKLEAAEAERNAARRRRKERDAEQARARRRAAREAAERAWFERERAAWIRAWTDAALVEAGFRARYVRDMLFDLSQREEARRRRLKRQGVDPGPAPQAALLEVLAQVLRTDLRDVARAVAEVLDERADLFPASVGHPAVLGVVERALPQVPDPRFGAWCWLGSPPAWPASPPPVWPASPQAAPAA